MINYSQSNAKEVRLLAKQGDPQALEAVIRWNASAAASRQKAREQGRPYKDKPERSRLRYKEYKEVRGKATAGDPEAIAQREKILTKRRKWKTNSQRRKGVRPWNEHLATRKAAAQTPEQKKAKLAEANKRRYPTYKAKKLLLREMAAAGDSGAQAELDRLAAQQQVRYARWAANNPGKTKEAKDKQRLARQQAAAAENALIEAGDVDAVARRTARKAVKRAQDAARYAAAKGVSGPAPAL